MADAKLNPKKFGLALGVLYGACLLVWAWVAAATGLWTEAIAFFGNIYFAYAATPLGGIAGLIQGFIEGLIGGYIFAWLYNKFK